VDGRGGALSLHGDVGVGKSALLREAAAGATGSTVLTRAAASQESTLPTPRCTGC